MMLFQDKVKPIKPLDRSSIQTLTVQLNDMLNIYENYIHPRDEHQKEVIEELRHYTDLLFKERYDLLITDPSVIHDDLS